MTYFWIWKYYLLFCKRYKLWYGFYIISYYFIFFLYLSFLLLCWHGRENEWVVEVLRRYILYVVFVLSDGNKNVIAVGRCHYKQAASEFKQLIL
jgi:membrane-associated phospholipid phosphatase